jgi:CHAD domain-containing protein
VAIRSILGRQIVKLLDLEHAARGLSPEAVHQMRSAARKLRGTIRVLGPLLDRLWAKSLSDEVRWLARQLGEVRDLDVLLGALDRREAEAPGSVPESLRDAIHERRHAARCSLVESLDSPRYEFVRARLVEAARRPAIEADAGRPAGPALRRRLFKRAGAIRRSATRLDSESSEVQFHELRKRGKDLRFAAQALAPWLGKKRGARADQFASRIAKGTDLLGVFQDHVVGIQIVSDVASSENGDGAKIQPAVARWVAEQAELRGVAIGRFLEHRKRWVRRADLQWMK